MNNIIYNELLKVKVANISNLDKNINEYLIPKHTDVLFEIGSFYLIKVNSAIVNNNTSILAINWNRSTSPSCEYMKVIVSKINGQMIYIDSIGFNNDTQEDININWSGWLNIDTCSIIKKL